MPRPKILVQLDSDAQASVFDAVVAVDAGVDQLLQYRAVDAGSVRALVHGAIFTRGMADLHHTAIFVGGSDVTTGETLLQEVRRSFFGPMRVSVLFDANGANTTAVAAVLVARRHVELAGATATVLAGTGPVGQRTARLLARAGAHVRVASRRLDRASATCTQIRQAVADAQLVPYATSTSDETARAIDGCDILVAAGAAGVELVPADLWQSHVRARVAIDLNAVPPAGLSGVEPHDKAIERDGTICYGAIGTGGLKMKIHKAAIRSLFETNDRWFDADELYQLGCSLDSE